MKLYMSPILGVRDDVLTSMAGLSKETEEAYLEWISDGDPEREYWEQCELEAKEEQARIDAKTLGISGAEQLLFDKVKKWLYMSPEDYVVLEFVLAMYKSHEMDHENSPLWGIVVGPSSGGKSEFLRALLERNDVFHLSKATPNSFVSGWRIKKKGKVDKDPSLLLLMDGKVVVIPDFSPILSQRPEARNEILGFFREAYDGKISDGKGNLGNVVYRSRFTLLTAATSKIDELGGEISELGERFIRIRFRGKDGMLKARQASQNVPHVAQMRSELKEALSTFFLGLGKMNEVVLSDGLRERIADLATFTAQARSPVYRDRYTRDVTNNPVPEEGGRLAIQLCKLVRAVALVRGRKEVTRADVTFIERVAEDCLPPNRLTIIQQLRKDPTRKWTGHELAKKLKASTTGVRRDLEDLQLLGTLDVEYGENDSKRYFIKMP
jgi:hypothetical protein